MKTLTKRLDAPEDLGSALVVWAVELQPTDYRFVNREKLLAFRLWASRLSSLRAKRVANEILSLCQISGLDREWFRETLIHPLPSSHSAKMALFFGLAIHERWLSKYHLRLIEWYKAPRTRRNREFALLLYANLVEAGFICQPGEMLLASSAHRAAIIESAIFEMYSKNYPLLSSLVREIIFLQEHQQPFYTISALCE